MSNLYLLEQTRGMIQHANISDLPDATNNVNLGLQDRNSEFFDGQQHAFNEALLLNSYVEPPPAPKLRAAETPIEAKVAIAHLENDELSEISHEIDLLIGFYPNLILMPKTP